eukprot:8274839-Pyramimonas_sp.AAC.1
MARLRGMDPDGVEAPVQRAQILGAQLHPVDMRGQRRARGKTASPPPLSALSRPSSSLLVLPPSSSPLLPPPLLRPGEDGS